MNRRNAMQLPPRLATAHDEPHHDRSSHVAESEIDRLYDLPADDDNALTCARLPYGHDDDTRGPMSSHVAEIEHDRDDSITTCATFALDARDSVTMWGAAPSPDEAPDTDRPGPLDLDAVRRDLFDDFPSGFANELDAGEDAPLEHDDQHDRDQHDDHDDHDDGFASPIDAFMIPPPPRMPDPASLRPRIAELQRVMEKRVSMVDAEEAQAHAAQSSARSRPAPYAPPSTYRAMSQATHAPAYPAMSLPPPAPPSWRDVPPSSRGGMRAPNAVAAPPFELTVSTLCVILTGLAALAVIVCAIVFAQSDARSRRPIAPQTPVPVADFDAPLPRPAGTTVVIAPPPLPVDVAPSSPPAKPAAAVVVRGPAAATPVAAAAPAATPSAAKATKGAGKYKSLDEILNELGEQQLRR